MKKDDGLDLNSKIKFNIVRKIDTIIILLSLVSLVLALNRTTLLNVEIVSLYKFQDGRYLIIFIRVNVKLLYVCT